MNTIITIYIYKSHVQVKVDNDKVIKRCYRK